MRRRLLAAVGVVALLAMAAPSGAEEAEWRFSAVLPGEGPEDFLRDMAGGGDVTGDGIDDVVVQVLPGATEAEARVVSGAPRGSWVFAVATRGEASGLVVVGPPDRNGRPVPVACDPGIVGDVSGDGIDELVVASCPPPLEAGPPRVWVVFGSPVGGEVQLVALRGAGFEVDVSPLPDDARIGRVAVLERVDAAGSPGVAVTVHSPSAGSEVRVYRLTGSGGELWAVYEGGSQVRSAGDFHGTGRSDVALTEVGEDAVEVVVTTLPSAPTPEPRRVGDLGPDEATQLRRFERNVHQDPELGGSDGLPSVQYDRVGDVNGDGFDDVAVELAVDPGSGGGGDLGRRSVVRGGAPSGGERHEEFDIHYSDRLGSFLDPPQAMGDLNGDGLDDFAFHDGSEAFFVVYGSRVVESIDLDRGGPRLTRIPSPQPAGLSFHPAPVGSGGDRPPSVALTAGDALLVFEPPLVPLRRAVAFDGDPATVDYVGQDTDEVSEAIKPARAAAIVRSVTVSRRAFPGSGARHVVLATADGFADALAASPLLGGGPLLLTEGDELPEIVRDEIHRVLPDGGRVFVLGGPAAVDDDVMRPLRDDCIGSSGHCYDVLRVAGGSRVETAAAVARLVGAGPGGEVAVARAYGTPDESGADVTGAGWADAVTAGGWAAATGTPVLLTPSGEGLHPAVADAVAELGVSSTVVLGGTAAVAEQAAAQLPGVRRVAGRDRSETAVAVAEQLWPAGTTRRILVDGYREDGWTAGLPAAALAADGDAPLLLSDGETLPPATAAALRACPPQLPADVLLVGAGPPADAVLAAQRC